MYDLSEQQDAAILIRYRETHDVHLVGELFRRYRHLAFGVCQKYLKNSVDSEDAVMEIFEKLHLDLRKNEIGHFKSWLYTVARNHCLMQLRKAGLKVDFPDEMPPISDNSTDFTEGSEDKDLKEKLLTDLEKSLPMLKVEQRNCIEMFYLKDMSYKQIVEVTGMSLNEVKTNIQNGKLNLRKILSKNSLLLWLFFFSHELLEFLHELL